MVRRLLAMWIPIAALGAGCADRGPGYTPDPGHGAELFAGVCAQCHGFEAEGVKGRGADLIHSAFVSQSTDEELVAMIRGGRPATASHPAMPPKGGRLELTNADLADIVAHIRSLRRPTPEQ